MTNQPLPTGMAHRYEQAWNKLFYECKPYAQRLIIEEPFGRHATDLAHQVAMMAEGINPNTGQPDDEIAQPILAPSGQQ